MHYLKKPSTYVIGAAAIVLYMWVWPMVAGGLRMRSSAGDGSNS